MNRETFRFLVVSVIAILIVMIVGNICFQRKIDSLMEQERQLQETLDRQKSGCSCENGKEKNNIPVIVIRASIKSEEASKYESEDASEEINEEVNIPSEKMSVENSEEVCDNDWHESVFRIYHYCPCKKCCGKSPSDRGYGLTASGTIATSGRTIAVDKRVIPIGSEVEINGKVYIAEDTGSGIVGNTIDIFTDSHQDAINRGTYLATVRWR